MDELLAVLSLQNPHWSQIQQDTGVKRPRYLHKILRYLETGEIVVLNGVRRSGKTTLLKQTVEELIQIGKKPSGILFVNCDDPLIQKLQEPLPDILETFQTNVSADEDITLIFDEIQTIPKWELWLKAWYDLKKYKIIISGSSAKLLDSGLSSKISGRYLKIHVYPLDFSEYLQFRNISVPSEKLEFITRRYEIGSLLREYIQYGGFPAAVRIENQDIRKDHLSTYFDSILFRDIEEMHDVRNHSVLRRLLVYLITNISAPFSYRKLALMYNVDSRIVIDYISFAEDAFLLFELQNFSYSLKSQNTGHKKIYTIDTGLRNSVAFSFSADEGRLVENLVFVNLKQNGYSIYFWKDKNEVDFVIPHRDYTLSAINVCYSDDIPEREIKGLNEFENAFKGKIKARIVITKDVEKQEDGILFIPLYKWLLAGSGDILQEME